MPAEGWVVDASVLGAAFFEEIDTVAARRFLAGRAGLLAPALLAVEIGSIAAKKVWGGLASSEVCERAIVETGRLVILVEPSPDLALVAFRLARDHRFSVYDASYLALAQARGLTLVTLDARLAKRADERGLGALVSLLSPA